MYWTSFVNGSLRKWMPRLLLGTFYITMSLMKEMRGTSQMLRTQHDRTRSCIGVCARCALQMPWWPSVALWWLSEATQGWWLWVRQWRRGWRQVHVMCVCVHTLNCMIDDANPHSPCRRHHQSHCPWLWNTHGHTAHCHKWVRVCICCASVAVAGKPHPNTNGTYFIFKICMEEGVSKQGG